MFPLCDLTLMIASLPKLEPAEPWLIQLSAFEDAVWLPGLEQNATEVALCQAVSRVELTARVAAKAGTAINSASAIPPSEMRRTRLMAR